MPGHDRYVEVPAEVLEKEEPEEDVVELHVLDDYEWASKTALAAGFVLDHRESKDATLSSTYVHSDGRRVRLSYAQKRAS